MQLVYAMTERGFVNMIGLNRLQNRVHFGLDNGIDRSLLLNGVGTYNRRKMKARGNHHINVLHHIICSVCRVRKTDDHFMMMKGDVTFNFK